MVSTSAAVLLTLATLFQPNFSYETFHSELNVTSISVAHASRCRYLRGIYLPEDVTILNYTQKDTPKNLNCTEGCDESNMMYRTRCDKIESFKSNSSVAFTCAYELTSPHLFLKEAILSCTFLTTPGCISDKNQCQIDYALTSASPKQIPALNSYGLLIAAIAALTGAWKNL